MGQKIAAALRALGILLGIWGVLGAIAYFAGVIPPEAELADDDSETEATPDPETEVAETDPAVPATDPEVAGATPDTIGPVDEVATETGGTEAATEPEATPAGAFTRHARVCDSVEHARVGVGSVVGDASPERIVICGRKAHVFAPTASGYARLATLTLEGDAQVRMAPPVVADVNGDDLQDLVLGWTQLDAEGGPDGGTLRVIAGDPSGGFGDADALAALSVVALEATELDGRPGADLVALHWADGFGRRPSEAYVFAGGPSPRRLARRRLRHDGVAVAVADLNADGHLDLITLDAEGAQIADGDGAGRFPRFRSVPLEAGRDIVVVRGRSMGDAEADESGDGAEADGDAAPEESADPEESAEPQEAAAPVGDTVYLVGDSVLRLQGEAEPTTLAAPHGILRALAGPEGALVAMTRQRVALVGDGTDRTVVDLPGTFRPADIALLEGRTLLVLGRTASGWELLETELGEGTARLAPGTEAAQPEDAPLVLDLVLH